MKKLMQAALLVSIAVALPNAFAQAPSATQIVNSAAEALGGKARVMAVKTLSATGGGNTFTAGGIGISPDAAEQRTLITDYKRDLDIANGRMHFSQKGSFQYPFALGLGNQADQHLDGDVAFGPPGGGGRGAGGGGGAAAPGAGGAAGAAGDGGGRGGNPPATLVRANAAAWHQRRLDYLSNPITAIRAALDPAAKLSMHTPMMVAGMRAVDVTTPQGESFTLGVDRTGLPNWISWPVADANLGDVTQQVIFQNYTDVSGVKLPARVETMTDRWTTGDFTLKYTVDGDVGDLSAPAAVKNAPAPQPQPPAPQMVTAEPIAKGIWYMGGTGEHSILFEFADHLVLFETPGGDARTLPVIQKARETVPGKPLTIAINSHQHFDHAGGFRAAVSEGLTMYAYKDNVGHFKEIAARPHTLNPDALQKNPKPLKIMPVDDMMEMKDAQMDIVIYHVHPAEITHTSTELMVWVPRDKLLVEADQFDHTWLRHLWGENFIWNVEGLRKLDVDKIVPVHGTGPENWTDVVTTIRSKPTYFRTDVPDF